MYKGGCLVDTVKLVFVSGPPKEYHNVYAVSVSDNMLHIRYYDDDGKVQTGRHEVSGIISMQVI